MLRCVTASESWQKSAIRNREEDEEEGRKSMGGERVLEVECGMMGLLGKLDRSDRWDVTACMMNELSVTLPHHGVVTVNPWG